MRVFCLDGPASHSKILTMSNQQVCAPSLLVDRESRWGLDLEDNAESSPLERAYAPPFLEVDTEVVVATPLHSQAHKHDPYACSVPRSLIGLMIGDQVRITRGPDDYAIYTIVERRYSDNPNIVR